MRSLCRGKEWRRPGCPFSQASVVHNRLSCMRYLHLNSAISVQKRKMLEKEAMSQCIKPNIKLVTKMLRQQPKISGYCRLHEIHCARGERHCPPVHSSLGLSPLSHYFQYHPTSGLMQILDLDWLRYLGTISNIHRVAKLAGLSFVFSPNKYFFNLHLLTLLLAFLSYQLGDTKTIRPFVLKGQPIRLRLMGY